MLFLANFLPATAIREAFSSTFVRQKEAFRNDIPIQSRPRHGLGQRKDKLHAAGIGSADGCRPGSAAALVRLAPCASAGCAGLPPCRLPEPTATPPQHLRLACRHARGGSVRTPRVLPLGLEPVPQKKAGTARHQPSLPPLRCLHGDAAAVLPPSVCHRTAAQTPDKPLLLRGIGLLADGRRMPGFCREPGAVVAEGSALRQRERVVLVRRSVYAFRLRLVPPGHCFARRRGGRAGLRKGTRLCVGISFRQRRNPLPRLFHFLHYSQRQICRKRVGQQRRDGTEAFVPCPAGRTVVIAIPAGG